MTTLEREIRNHIEYLDNEIVNCNYDSVARCQFATAKSTALLALATLEKA